MAIQRTIPTLLMKRLVQFLIGFGLSFGLVVGLANITPAMDSGGANVSPQELIERSQAQWRNGDLSGAIQTQQSVVERLRQDPSQRVNVAISLTNLGRLNLQAGYFHAAVDHFTEADRLYPESDRHRFRNRSYQAQALRQVGQTQTACLMLVDTLWSDWPTSPGRSLCDAGTADRTTLDTLDPIITQQPEVLQADLLRELGITLRRLGHLDASAQILSRFTDGATQLAWANTKRAQGNLIRDRLASPRYDALPWRFESERFSAVAIGLGRASSPEYQQMQQYYQAAQQGYAELEQHPDSDGVNIEVQLNHLSLQLDQVAVLTVDDPQYAPTVNTALALAQAITVDALPRGQTQIFAHIALAKQQTFLNQILNTEAISWNSIQKLLDNAEKIASSLNNPQIISYVVGNIGSLYEYFDWLEHQEALISVKRGWVGAKSGVNSGRSPWRDRAVALTQSALINAQPADAPEIAYQWQWQLGRLAAVSGNREGAIAHYHAAVDTLETVRNDLLNVKADVRFSFRDNIEPIYRGLVDVLLAEPSLADLQEAVNRIDRLQLTELENFLGCNLESAVNVQQQWDEIDPKAAFLYPIILRDRLEVIAKLPGQPLTHYATLVPSDRIEETLNRFHKRVITIGGTPSGQLASDAQIYDWLLKPIEGAIANSGPIETIVFVPDSAFRNVSLAALYDSERQQYVVEKTYATVLLPSVQLFALDQTRQHPKVLAVGVSEPQVIDNEVFSPLAADQEIATIQRIIPDTYALLDAEASPLDVEDKLVSIVPSILHFASHGKFSSDPDATYIVLYQELLKSYQLDDLLQASPTYINGIDLLTLATCQSASGDNRAVLGLAGVAINANARSTLASLWNTKDEATIQFMEEFYRYLSDPTIKKSEALHRAQQSIQQTSGFQLPYFWAPFTLIGNWK
ncbi:MAG: CHAT domain-containing protein [Leptolyngbyaceae cyanobacterium]